MITKTRRGLWVDLPPELAGALSDSRGGRQDRDPAAPMFAESGADALRTAIGTACRGNGVPLFARHDLRHRRISVLHRQGRTFAEIAQLIGQKKHPRHGIAVAGAAYCATRASTSERCGG